jgi:anti-sigma factor RsiW
VTCAETRHQLGAYVLGGLEPEEAAAVRAHLEGCPDCAREESELAGLPAMLDLVEAPEATLQRPAPALEEAILDRHARERRALRLHRDRHRVRRRGRSAGLTGAAGRRDPHRPLLGRRGRLVAALSAAAAAVAVAAVVLASGGSSPVSPPPATAAVLDGGPGAPRAQGTAWLRAVPAGTSVRLRAHGLPGGRSFELWCIRFDGRWVSAGTFRAAGNGHADVRLTAAVRRGEYGQILVTPRDDREPAALQGSVTGY